MDKTKTLQISQQEVFTAYRRVKINCGEGVADLVDFKKYDDRLVI